MPSYEFINLFVPYIAIPPVAFLGDISSKAEECIWRKVCSQATCFTTNPIWIAMDVTEFGIRYYEEEK
jgi:hypothetical protein